MPISPQETKRLALIRFLYMDGLEQVARPAPLSSQALLSFHDTVEMFLLLAAEHLSVNLSRGVNFDGYFSEIKASSDVEIPLRPAMRRMNNSRVNLKHHGSIPSDADLEQFRADVTTFLTDATQLVFQADFTRIDMVDLVTQQDAADKLRKAETQAGQGDYVEALATLSEAFDGLLDDYASRKIGLNGGSPYAWGPPAPPGLGIRLKGRDHDPEVVKRLEYVNSRVNDMQRPMRVMAMGVDYRRYARFKMLVPQILRFLDGRREVRPVPGFQLGDDEYQFCKQFVIETALHLAELDFDLNLAAFYRNRPLRVALPELPTPPEA